jgi:hypothetical protein
MPAATVSFVASSITLVVAYEATLGAPAGVLLLEEPLSFDWIRGLRDRQ